MAKLTLPYLTLPLGTRREFWTTLAVAGLKTSYSHKTGVVGTTYYNVVIEGTDAQVARTRAWLERLAGRA